MNTSIISREGNDVKFEMVFDAETFDNAQVEIYKQNKDKYNVDGFRAGKAPRKIIEQKFGEGVFMEDAVEQLMQMNYPEAIATLELDPIDMPRVEFSVMKKGEGFTATLTVEVEPEMEVKDYTGVKIKQITHEITEEDIQKELDNLVEKNIRIVTVDAAAEEGNTVVIDYAGFLGEEQFEGGTAEGHSLKIGSGQFIPGFEEQLIGTKAGDEVEVNVSFPEEYHAEHLAGQPVVFKVKVNEVKTEEKPELTDELVQDSTEFETVDALKADIEEKLNEYARNRAEGDMKNAVLEGVFEANEIEVPAKMIENSLDEMLNEFAQSLQQQGMNMDQYLQYLGQDIETFRESIKGDAEKRTKMRLIVKAVAKAEEYEASDAEVEAELTMMAEQYGLELEKIREILGESQIAMMKMDIVNRKAVDYMFETAIIE